MTDEQTACEYCGGDHHWKRCRRITAIDYRDDGSYRVEFGPQRGGPARMEARGMPEQGIKASRVTLTPEQVERLRNQPRLATPGPRQTRR